MLPRGSFPVPVSVTLGSEAPSADATIHHHVKAMYDFIELMRGSTSLQVGPGLRYFECLIVSDVILHLIINSKSLHTAS